MTTGPEAPAPPPATWVVREYDANDRNKVIGEHLAYSEETAFRLYDLFCRKVKLEGGRARLFTPEGVAVEGIWKP